MKALICCLNSKYIHASLAPWCLVSGVKAFSKTCWEIKVMESTINADLEAFVSNIVEENPDIVSFSSYIWNIEKTLKICNVIKKQINCKIVLGGPEVSYRAEEVLRKYNFIDFVLSGEGEESYPALLDELSGASLFSNVAGLSFREGDSVVSVSEKECFNTPPSPYTEDFFENLNGRISYIETSRGCPYRCAFCLSGRCSALRYFDLETVEKDIIKLANSGTQTIKFVDRTFNADYKRANKIITFILENRGKQIPENVCFHFEIAGDILKEETFKLLENAPVGLFQLEIGMQSFNEETLAMINRKTDTKKLISNIKRLVSMDNMHIHIDLIAGLTGEGIESFERSFNIGYGLKAQMLQMGFLKLLYGADMREYPEKYPCKFSEQPPYEVTDTPWLSNKEITSLKKCEDALERMYNSGRFIYTLDYLTEDCGFTPFKLFYDFGNAVDGNKMSLTDYSVRIFEYFRDYCDSELLREKLICDLLSCSSALQIPEFFKIRDPLYKRVKKHFTENTQGHNKIAILYKQKKIFVVNQKSLKDLRGRYKGRFYDLNKFE